MSLTFAFRKSTGSPCLMRISSFRSPKTDVRPSKISGRGLFAKERIRRDEIVCVKSGHLIGKAEFEQYKDVINGADLQISDNLFLAPLNNMEFEDVMMFLNHSCAPNVGISGQIVFVAMRDIAAEEELTLDYATIDHDSDPMICSCGAPECRQLVTRDDWRIPALQEKYGDFFAWYLLRKIRAG
jgi:uncharacterized protein